jgi:hypothetical protein
MAEETAALRVTGNRTMQLLKQLRCLFHGHTLGEIEPDVFWFSATCNCCGKTVTADTALELLMMRQGTIHEDTLLPSSPTRQVQKIAPAV